MGYYAGSGANPPAPLRVRIYYDSGQDKFGIQSSGGNPGLS